MQYHSNLSLYIKELRKSKKISLNSFAYKNSIEPSTLSRVENSQLELKMSVLEKIAKGFNLTPAELLTLFENQNKST